MFYFYIKGQDKSNPNNYCPISKLSCLAKILESLVNKQLTIFIRSHYILKSYQSGFRPKHSTITATTLVVNDIVSALDKNQHCAALFIDLSMAFDTVDYLLLLQRLSCIGFDSAACKWFANYLSERHQCVMVGDVKFEFLHISKGVPQGSILGPILFTLYINDVAKTLLTVMFISIQMTLFFIVFHILYKIPFFTCNRPLIPSKTRYLILNWC